MLNGMSTVQIAVRVDRDQLDVLDGLIEDGEFESRADAVRAALAAVIVAVEARRIDEDIRAGYTRLPPTADDNAAANAALRTAIAQEPW